LLHETRTIGEMNNETKTNGGPFNENHEPLKRDLSNKDESLDFLEASADKVNVRHLFHADFSQVCTTAPSGDKMALLAARKRLQAANEAKIKAEAVAEEDAKGLGFKPEGSPRKQGVQKQGSVHMATSVRPGQTGATYFADPTVCEPGMLDVAESAADRALRIALWMMMVALMVNFQELIHPILRYDTATLYIAINTLCFGRGVADVLDAVTEMTVLKKTRALPWATFQGQVVRLRNNLGRITNPYLQMGERVLVEFVMRALDSDAAYAVELALCRKDLAVTLEEVMRTMTTVARTVEGPTSALITQVQANFSKAPTDERTCWDWEKFGTCKFTKNGGKCKFSHAGPKGTKVRSSSSSAPRGGGGADGGANFCQLCKKTGHVLDTCYRMMKLAKIEEAEKRAGGDDETNGDLAGNVAISRASDASGSGVYGGAFGAGGEWVDTEFLNTVQRIAARTD
jgi:hypothetical protein